MPNFVDDGKLVSVNLNLISLVHVRTITCI